MKHITTERGGRVEGRTDRKKEIKKGRTYMKKVRRKEQEEEWKGQL